MANEPHRIKIRKVHGGYLPFLMQEDGDPIPLQAAGPFDEVVDAKAWLKQYAEQFRFVT